MDPLRTPLSQPAAGVLRWRARTPARRSAGATWRPRWQALS